MSIIEARLLPVAESDNGLRHGEQDEQPNVDPTRIASAVEQQTLPIEENRSGEGQSETSRRGSAYAEGL